MAISESSSDMQQQAGWGHCDPSAWGYTQDPTRVYTRPLKAVVKNDGFPCIHNWYYSRMLSPVLSTQPDLFVNQPAATDENVFSLKPRSHPYILGLQATNISREKPGFLIRDTPWFFWSQKVAVICNICAGVTINKDGACRYWMGMEYYISH